MPFTVEVFFFGFCGIVMPSFDFTSDVDWVHLKNAVDVAQRQVANRYDFKGTPAQLLLNDKDKAITLFGESEFQLNQIKDLLFPAMEKKAPESTKRLKANEIEKQGNKLKQVLLVQSGIDANLAKKIVKLLKDSKLKVQASIQGDSVRVSGNKRDVLQEAIALIKKNCDDYPIQAGNFRD